MGNPRDVAKLILSSIESVNDSFLEKTTMGRAFLNHYAKKGTMIVPDDPSADHAVKQKIIYLKNCEVNGDICWMEYSSWNMFTDIYKEYFLTNIDPLLFGGIYFSRSRYLLHEEELLKRLLPGTSIFEIRQGSIIKLANIGSDSYQFDRMGDYAFRDYAKNFNANLVRAVGIDATGNVCVKVFQEEKFQ